MILVTGATGLSGSYIVRKLRQNGLSVRAFVRQVSASAVDDEDVEIAIGDLSDPDRIRRARDGVKGIIHAACTFTNSEVDFEALQALLDGWVRGPFVYFSSVAVYGYPNRVLIKETDSLDGTQSDYAHGKVFCEQLLMEKAGQEDRLDQVSILRAPHILAPHPKAYRKLIGFLGDKDTIVLPGVNEVEWSMYGDPYIDARDLAWIVGECLKRPIGGPANVLAGHFVWHDMCEEVIRLIGKDCRIVHKQLNQISDQEQPALHHISQSWTFDNSHLLELIDFQPTRSWQQTVAETILAGQEIQLDNVLKK